MLKCIGANVAIRIIQNDPQTRSGILLAPTRQEAPQIGVVLNVGPDAKHVAEGQQVIFRRFAQTEVKYQNEELYIVEEKDILGILEGVEGVLPQVDDPTIAPGITREGVAFGSKIIEKNKMVTESKNEKSRNDMRSNAERSAHSLLKEAGTLNRRVVGIHS